ncbi:hypothetical protein [Tsukamurella soli]|uniref:Uncharacterized protein n=1 Tax=Tsukamurella soli TaxID=644556 RepID=A0ABP8J0T1_9ACTN
MTGGHHQVLPVPVGTPGRDWRAALPAPLPDGSQLPWRRLGPGTRGWVVVVTVVACVALAAVTLTALVIGAVNEVDSRPRPVVQQHTGYLIGDAGYRSDIAPAAR